jgi:RNA polymerase sigma factor (sigma-70 family)
MTDDLELLSDYAANGSDAAFQTLVERYIGLVHGAALRQVRNPHLAEEITQAVFLVLARKAGFLRSGTILAGWLFRTTRFLAARAIRDERRRHHREQEAAQMEPEISSPATLWDEVAPSLDEALAHLGEADRLALLLRFFQQMELKEVGRLLGSSENAAAKRVSRALDKLRTFFARRGAVLSSAALVSVLIENAAHAAPAGLSTSTVAVITANTGTTSTLVFVKLAMKSILYTKIWTVGVSTVAILAVVGVGTLLAQKDPGREKALILPTEPGKSVVVEIPGLPPGAKKLEFVLVPGLGSAKPFLLGKYEVTQGQYEALMHANPSTFKKGPDYPMEQMSWQDAKDFCAQLDIILPADANMSFRLPTDEEWSIAAGLPEEIEGTLKQKSNKIRNTYPWGTNWPPPNTAGNYSDASNKKKYGPQMSYVPELDDGFEDTSPVGSFPPNKFGLYDMGGNVWEWCEDFVDERKKIHVVRGASWFTHSESQLLSAYRGIPPTRNFASGFRVKLDSALP